MSKVKRKTWVFIDQVARVQETIKEFCKTGIPDQSGKVACLYMVLRYKLPLNNELKKKFALNSDDFKYHYDTANEVLLDFQQYHTHYFHK